MREILSGLNAQWLEGLFQSEQDSASWQEVADSLEHVQWTRFQSQDLKAQDKQQNINRLINAYRDLGHIYARTNPLGCYMASNFQYAWVAQQTTGRDLELNNFGLDKSDLDNLFYCPPSFGCKQDTLRSINARLQHIYTGTMSAEYTHIKNQAMRMWLMEQLENETYWHKWTQEEKRDCQRDLIRAEEFERFIQSRFTGQKRFSLEGCEAVIPAMKFLFNEAGKNGINDIVIGMPHRGRLNFLVNSMEKNVAEIFAIFEGNYQPHSCGLAGDVKYHLGQSNDFELPDGKTVHISLISNPSHLEAVNPVVQGKVRGTQRLKNDIEHVCTLPVLIHGDAAFAGQGVVTETLNLSQLRGYRTGGTIHVVVNNQIGFTTASTDLRSTLFATDIAKIISAPVFRANCDHPESVIKAIKLALMWRQKFGHDVVVDMLGYRRLGHNEADEPSFTHPIMYDLIRKHESVSRIYGRKLIEESVFEKKDQDFFRKKYVDHMKHARDEAIKMTNYHGFSTLTGEWADIKREYSFEFPDTGVREKVLVKLREKLTEVPANFQVHPKLKRFIENRRKLNSADSLIDWSFAESLAFGSLLLENYSIRLSGEDCGRGTFSQRHAVWWDVSTKSPLPFTPLAALVRETGGKANFSIYDSPLSEFSVLGFEYGYSLAQPNTLVLWEAQFGDFANGAQVIIDQFISSGESKWARYSGLVMLLPHAYEGQGPEHSNAYLERYLSLCAEDNMQVVNVSTPVQFFHVLRKQQHQPFRKPLIVMTPKSLLRHPEARSRLSEFTSGRFQTIIDDGEPPEKTERVILCSGHVWYDLQARRREEITRNRTCMAARTRIIRLEQIYPFPDSQLGSIIGSLKDVREYFWVQEESGNRGAWSFVRHRLAGITGKEWVYVGRMESASPTTGSHEKHIDELGALLHNALGEKSGGSV